MRTESTFLRRRRACDKPKQRATLACVCVQCVNVYVCVCVSDCDNADNENTGKHTHTLAPLAVTRREGCKTFGFVALSLTLTLYLLRMRELYS